MKHRRLSPGAVQQKLSDSNCYHWCEYWHSNFAVPQYEVGGNIMKRQSSSCLKVLNILVSTVISISLFTLVLSCSSEAKDPAEDSLVGYWPFEAGSGREVKDLSGNGNHGEFVGNPEWVQGKFGRALEFDVVVPDSDSLDLTEEVTVMLWFRGNDVVTQTRVMSKNDSFFVMFDMDDDNTMELLIQTGRRTGSATKDWKVGEWYHFAGTFDNKGEIRIYINGVLDAEGQHDKGINPTNPDLWIGADDAGRPTDFFPGVIDEVRIYSKALTEAEIGTLMNTPSPVRIKAFLPAAWASIKMETR